MTTINKGQSSPHRWNFATDGCRAADITQPGNAGDLPQTSPLLPCLAQGVRPATLQTGQSNANQDISRYYPIISRRILDLIKQKYVVPVEIDNDLSKKWLDQFLHDLDPDQTIFLMSDIADFRKRYATELDNYFVGGQFEPASKIWELYKTRAEEHWNAIRRYLNSPEIVSTLAARRSLTALHSWPISAEQAVEFLLDKLATDYQSLPNRADAIAELRRSYHWMLVAEPTSRGLLWVMSDFINGMTNQLDPHTCYMLPAQQKLFVSYFDPQIADVGVELIYRNGIAYVQGTLPNSPAHGQCTPGQQLVAIEENGKRVPLFGKNQIEVTALLRGLVNSTVRLILAGADGKERTIALTRQHFNSEKMKVETSTATVSFGKNQYLIGILTLPRFYNNCSAEMSLALNNLKQQGISGIVVDLRGNLGGLMPEAVAAAGLFIKGGPIVASQERDKELEPFNDPDTSISYAGPLVVIIDETSASASEIFAGAIQDYDRGIIAGCQSWGKGVAQGLWPLGWGGFKITTARFYRISGLCPTGQGITPDLEFADDRKADRGDPPKWVIPPLLHDSYASSKPATDTPATRQNLLNIAFGNMRVGSQVPDLWRDASCRIVAHMAAQRPSIGLSKTANGR